MVGRGIHLTILQTRQKNMLLASFTAGLFIDRPMTDNTEGIRRRHHPILTRGRCAACDAAAAAPSAAGGN